MLQKLINAFYVASQEGRKFTLTSIPKVNPKIVSVDLSRKFTLALNPESKF